MRLYEYEAKRVFKSMGLHVPDQYGVIHSPADLDGLEIRFPAMLKSMVLVGGRGKAGGIKKAKDLAEAKTHAKSIFDLVIKGFPVETILLEDVASLAHECYVGITTNPATFNIIVMVSASGGMDIEQVAIEKPEAILKIEVPDNEMELPDRLADEFASFLAKEAWKSRSYVNFKRYNSKAICDVPEIRLQSGRNKSTHYYD